MSFAALNSSKAVTHKCHGLETGTHPQEANAASDQGSMALPPLIT
jgi:hypothetical protein